MYLKPGTEGRIKAGMRWDDGIYLGMRSRTEEYVIGTENGVIKVISIRRHGTEAMQWDKRRFEAFNGVPWEPVPGREGIEIRSHADIPDRLDGPKRMPEPEEKGSYPAESGYQEGRCDGSRF